MCCSASVAANLFPTAVLPQSALRLRCQCLVRTVNHNTCSAAEGQRNKSIKIPTIKGWRVSFRWKTKTAEPNRRVKTRLRPELSCPTVPVTGGTFYRESAYSPAINMISPQTLWTLIGGTLRDRGQGLTRRVTHPPTFHLQHISVSMSH